MEIGTQIKQYRNAAGMNQEELAQTVYVTRQTLSNWENGRTYPDINRLLRLSDVFHVSLDELVKGDIPKMKEQIKQEDICRFNQESNVFAVLMLVMMLSAVPLTAWRFPLGGVLWLSLVAVTLYSSFRVEKLKKSMISKPTRRSSLLPKAAIWTSWTRRVRKASACIRRSFWC